ncbi:MAG: nucleoside triphosphate pyrophosphohydrolase [Bernardetiaceae bacterium]|jgi:XTP/dITP diphosphohydrolase|nr:nucleoside triphosphate pyrophosphohydrolase [Bernardetiaceae bacterium]
MTIDPQHPRYAAAFARLLQTMNELREQCPWDRKQTFESLRHLTVEETYELADAIMARDLAQIRNELGDLLLHVVFYSRLAAEEQAFDIADVMEQLCDKLVRRHPHIYGQQTAEDEEAVKRNWEQIKLQEKAASGEVPGILSGVPTSLPALVKAMRVQEKARGAGFDWERKEQVWEKVEEEMQEFKAEFNAQADAAIDRDRAEAEFGDLLFSLVNYARFINLNPETALERTNRKFMQRFNYLETESRRDGKNLTQMTLAEMDVYWERAKKLAK